MESKKDNDFIGYLMGYIGIVVILIFVSKSSGGIVSKFDTGITKPIAWDEVIHNHLVEILLLSLVLILMARFIIKISTPKKTDKHE